ncbi:hypothetical protein, partial [Prevotella aurantiaca]
SSRNPLSFQVIRNKIGRKTNFRLSNSTFIGQSTAKNAITQKKTPLKPKQVRIADQHKTKQIVPNNGKKKQSSPSFNNTRNKSETPKY